MTQAMNIGEVKRARPSLRLPGFFGEIVRTIIFVIVVTVLFDMAIPRSLVDGHSMVPTFQDGDRLIVSRLSYLFSDPQRGDIFVFNSVTPGEDGIMLIKRVIGVPGDKIEIRDRQVYVNDTLIEEPYILEMCQSRCQDQVWNLGADEYFAMGDNRNNSIDSRRFGVVPKDHIVGTVIFRYWPINTFGFLAHPIYSIDNP